jgi:hypothetical protein
MKCRVHADKERRVLPVDNVGSLKENFLGNRLPKTNNRISAGKQLTEPVFQQRRHRLIYVLGNISPTSLTYSASLLRKQIYPATCLRRHIRYEYAAAHDGHPGGQGIRKLFAELSYVNCQRADGVRGN